MTLNRLLRMVPLLAASVVWAAAACAAEDVASLQGAFLRGEYERVAQEAGRLRRKGSAEKDRVLYLHGTASLKLGRWEEARGSLHELLDQHPGSRWRPYAWLALGDGWQAAGVKEEALKAYEKVRREPGGAELEAQVRLRIAKAQRPVGQWEEADPEQGDLGFSVQVGAFVSRENAARLADELKRRGHRAEVREGTMEGKQFYRVRVGKFSRRPEAAEKARELEQEGFPARVVP